VGIGSPTGPVAVPPGPATVGAVGPAGAAGAAGAASVVGIGAASACGADSPDRSPQAARIDPQTVRIADSRNGWFTGKILYGLIHARAEPPGGAHVPEAACRFVIICRIPPLS
jgi:hypothetical protein